MHGLPVVGPSSPLLRLSDLQKPSVTASSKSFTLHDPRFRPMSLTTRYPSCSQNAMVVIPTDSRPRAKPPMPLKRSSTPFAPHPRDTQKRQRDNRPGKKQRDADGDTEVFHNGPSSCTGASVMVAWRPESAMRDSMDMSVVRG